MSYRMDLLMEELDLKEIRKVLLEFASNILSGQVPEIEKWRVTLSVPKPLGDAVVRLSKQIKKEPEEIFSELASKGLTKYFSQEIAENPPSIEDNPLSQMGLDLSQLTGGLDKIKGLGSQLEGFKKLMDQFNAQIPEDKKNNK